MFSAIFFEMPDQLADPGSTGFGHGRSGSLFFVRGSWFVVRGSWFVVRQWSVVSGQWNTGILEY